MQSIPDDPGRRGAVAVVSRSDKMLVIRRSEHVVAPGVYCFPGGGIESGETEEDTLRREFLEEVGVVMTPLRRVWECLTPWKVHLAWWTGRIAPDAIPKGDPREVESIHWLTPEEMLAQAELLESNRRFLELVLEGEIKLD